MFSMPRRSITVAEMPLFVRQAESVWDDEQREEFVLYIAANPEAGDVIPDTGGVRKLRWSRAVAEGVAACGSSISITMPTARFTC